MLLDVDMVVELKQQNFWHTQSLRCFYTTLFILLLKLKQHCSQCFAYSLLLVIITVLVSEECEDYYAGNMYVWHWNIYCSLFTFVFNQRDIFVFSVFHYLFFFFFFFVVSLTKFQVHIYAAGNQSEVETCFTQVLVS